MPHFKRERHTALAQVGIGRGDGRRIQLTTFRGVAVVTTYLLEISGAAARAMRGESWHIPQRCMEHATYWSGSGRSKIKTL